MFTYLKLAGVALILALWGYTLFLSYNKGKDSVFKGVLAGVAVNQEKDNTETQAALAKAEELGKLLATTEAQKNELVKKLKASVKVAPRVECQLQPDELQSLQQAADSTK